MAVAISKKGRDYEGGWVGATYAGAQTNLSLVAAPGAGRAIFIDYVHITNLSAANVIELRDGSGGASQWTTNCPAAAMYEDACLPYPRGLTDNTALCLNTTAAAAHSVYVLYHIEPTKIG